jgi:hypothetical protein
MTNCLGCRGKLTRENVSPVNDAFHKICMNDGIKVPFPPGKYTAEELRGTWAEYRLQVWPPLAFASIAAASEWWKENAAGREVGVLVDFTDIGEGIQRREFRRDSRVGWVISFATYGETRAA